MSFAPTIKKLTGFQVDIEAGPLKGQRMSFNKESVTIGRDPENDIVLVNDSSVSRKHAEIKMHGSDFVIINLSAKNFVLLDGVSIQTERLNKGSLIQIGNSEIRFFPLGIKEESQENFKTQNVENANKPAPPAHPMGSTQFQAPTVKGPLGQTTPQPALKPGPATVQSPGPTGVSNWSQSGSDFNYSQQKSSHSSYKKSNSVGGSSADDGRVRFYIIVMIIGFLGWYLLFSDSGAKKKDPNSFKTSTETFQDLADAEKRTQELLALKKDKFDTIQFKKAQENFIRGFRDFQQGQYARSQEAFQVVLNLDPDNELAKRYYHLSRVKFDELIKFNLIQGNRYREKRNWRMCQSNYFNVITMLQNRKDDPVFKEAKQFYEECSLKVETGRF